MKSTILSLLFSCSLSFCFSQKTINLKNNYETFVYDSYWQKSKRYLNNEFNIADSIKIDSVVIKGESEFDSNYLVTEIYLRNNYSNDLKFVASDTVIFADLYEVIEVADYGKYLSIEDNGSLNRMGVFPKMFKFKYIGNYLDTGFPNWDQRKQLQISKNSASKLICIIPKPTKKLADYKITMEVLTWINRERYTYQRNLEISSGLRIKCN